MRLRIDLANLYQEKGLTNDVLELSRKLDQLIVKEQKDIIDKYKKAV
ncbi:Spo0E family sporulation regulatory protein-aspartic acid phosphatase [Clostridium sp.]